MSRLSAGTVLLVPEVPIMLGDAPMAASCPGSRGAMRHCVWAPRVPVSRLLGRGRSSLSLPCWRGLAVLQTFPRFAFVDVFLLVRAAGAGEAGGEEPPATLAGR